MGFMQFAVDTAQENPIVTGGILMAVLMYMLRFLKPRVISALEMHLPSLILGQIERRIEIPATSFAPALDSWRKSGNARIIWSQEVYEGAAEYEIVKSADSIHSKEQLKMSIEFGPGSKFLVLYRKRPVYMSYVSEKEGSSKRTMFIVRSFTHSISELKEFVNHVSSFKTNKREDEGDVITMFRASMKHGIGWEHSQIRKRPRGSLILPEELMVEIQEKIDKFIQSRDKYVMAGAPYKKGILLYGPPGTGKSSLAEWLASEYNMNIYTIPIGSKLIEDHDLISLISGVAWNSIVLLEDIDSANCAITREDAVVAPMTVKSVNGVSSMSSGGVTMTGLLNVLSGVGAREGVIYIMTTNFPEKLDPALLREGRTDHKFFIDNATHYQIAKMFLKFFPESDCKDAREIEALRAMAKEFSELFEERKESMAAIQGHLITNWSSPQKAIDEARKKIAEIGTVGDPLYQFKVNSTVRLQNEANNGKGGKGFTWVTPMPPPTPDYENNPLNDTLTHVIERGKATGNYALTEKERRRVMEDAVRNLPIPDDEDY